MRHSFQWTRYQPVFELPLTGGHLCCALCSAVTSAPLCARAAVKAVALKSACSDLHPGSLAY